MVSLWTLCDLIMNDKLKELSDIAYQKHLKNYTFSSFGRRSDYDKEFAELIVRECVGICAKQAWESLTNDNWTEYNALSRVAVQIKQHFGVE